MGRKSVFGLMLCGVAATMLAAPAFAQQDRVSATEKGSLLYFSKVELRWTLENSEWVLSQDTFLQVTNDYPEDVDVLFYFVNGDRPLPAMGDERAHPGWNWVDNQLTLTANQPVYWSAADGGILSPFTVLDPGDPPGRPAMDGTSDRVLRGFILGWAVDSIDGIEIRWNHLAGNATLVNYRFGAAFEYNAWAFQTVVDVENGDPTGISDGQLDLDGVEYAPPFAQLLMNFQAVGSSAFTGGNRLVVSNTDVTLHPVSVDLRQETDGPVTTKAHFDVWNMNEVKFSGAYRCITCWDQTLLSDYGIPNHFLIDTLQTAHGKARIDGLESQLCDELPLFESEDAAILGIVFKILFFDGNNEQTAVDLAAAGSNMFGMGTEPAVVKYDELGPPPELPGGEKGDVIKFVDHLLNIDRR